MATPIKNITDLCKAGRVEEAYSIALADIQAAPQDVWVQKSMAWVLYYRMKEICAKGCDFQSFVSHIDSVSSLSLLSVDNDRFIFESVVRSISEYAKSNLNPSNRGAFQYLSTLFYKIKNWNLGKSAAFSYLLSTFIKFEQWPQMAEFIEWWNLDNLSEDDFEPYVNEQRNKFMSLAERAYIAYSKALVDLHDFQRMQAFLPRLARLAEEHPEMQYSDYYYGKLLIAVGEDKSKSLQALIPFARKKRTEYWVWQLLSEVFADEYEKKLACLLKALNCGATENYLGKVRIETARMYLRMNDKPRAKFHIDQMVRCYLQNGWKIDKNVFSWFNTNEIGSITMDSTDSVDYNKISQEILFADCKQTYGVVTYVEHTDKKGHNKAHKKTVATVVYGMKKRTVCKVSDNVAQGTIVNLIYEDSQNGEIKVVSASVVKSFVNDLDFMKVVSGTVSKQQDKEFAFLKSGRQSYFISPNITKKHNLVNGENRRCKFVFDYNKKKDQWDWSCISVMSHNK